ncbi:hypothetical protein [Streptomyces fulvoviolaceus]|uniref:hypothetical protein n=1 Tax=Streptomyces fulvoviolaceus TaxID=285535 RepID=UPI0005BABCB5|nr:hypothetical protein [Streptomyces fulvoviolaceus]MCT9084790.1 hypothetical protein [Streptomyces fulvoviolaceus]
MRKNLPIRLRRLAVLAGAVAAAAYAWGLLHVAGAVMEAEDGGTDSAPIRPCRTAGWPERERGGAGIVDYSVSFVPLGFACETQGGGSYTTEHVPAYVNPVALGCALAAAGLGVSSGYASELRARAEARKRNRSAAEPEA